MSDFEKLAARLTDEGYLISGLIQKSKQVWVAWIRKTGQFSCGNGKGTTAYKALKDAQEKCLAGDAWERREKSELKRVRIKSKRVRIKG